MTTKQPAVWFPAVRCGTGTDVFTETLVQGLRQRGIRAEITWLPHRAEYLPWTVPVPTPPPWANLVHINTWLHPRFIPGHVPVVATLHHSIHDPALRPYKGGLRSAYHRWWIVPIERRVLHRAGRVVAVSRFVADMARQTLCDVPMQVIYNGIDTELFQPGDHVRQLDAPFRLLYVGSWMARKGVDLLAPIMRELGSGFELQYTGGQAADQHRSAMPVNMRDLGRLSGHQVIVAMQNADAFLFPSRSEGLPLVAIEAMACGLPVIAMEGTSIEEVVVHGRTGLLCKREDIRAFANAARAMATNRQLHLACSASARETATTQFRGDKMVDAYVETYRDLLEGKP
ncbi:MAG: glycosyltransferase [Xanthomonadaceae bacterium]|nr:glycosyltransferase [Xanthomonadaceae bacterium]